MNKQAFDIITFTPSPKRYYPASSGWESWMEGHYIPHTDIQIPLGASRIGGPIVDLPKGVSYPDNMVFTAQLDMSLFAENDKLGLLPKSGFLYFFFDSPQDSGKVFHADVSSAELVRVIKEHEDDFWDGVVIDQVYADVEKLSERYSEEFIDEENKDQRLNENGLAWDCFAGSGRSKVYGIMTHCQLDEESILDQLYSNEILLLQIGENGFNDEGVLSVMIDKQDLINKNFDHCKFYWGQS